MKEQFRELGPGQILKEMLDPKKAKKIIKVIKRCRKRMLKNKGKLLDELIRKKIIREEERINYSQDYLIEYLMLVAHYNELKTQGMPPILITISKDLLDRRKELEQKFAIKIRNPEEAMTLMEKEHQRMTEYIG